MFPFQSWKQLACQWNEDTFALDVSGGGRGRVEGVVNTACLPPTPLPREWVFLDTPFLHVGSLIIAWNTGHSGITPSMFQIEQLQSDPPNAVSGPPHIHCSLKIHSQYSLHFLLLFKSSRRRSQEKGAQVGGQWQAHYLADSESPVESANPDYRVHVSSQPRCSSLLFVWHHQCARE